MNQIVVLFDMDDTLCDLSGALARDMNLIKSPSETGFAPPLPGQKSPPYLKARKIMVFNQPNWWLNLECYEPGWDILYEVQKLGYEFQIASKPSPDCHDSARQKLEWVETYLGSVVTHLTGDKSRIRADFMVDDWIPYGSKWLDNNPNGRLIIPYHVWNKDFQHDRAIHCRGPEDLEAVRAVLTTPKLSE
mgnify:CR=1 FL=1